MLVAVLNREEWLEDILAGFLELGITGATVLDTEGMGRLLSHEIPIFAGLQTLTSRSRPRNSTAVQRDRRSPEAGGSDGAPPGGVETSGARPRAWRSPFP